MTACATLFPKAKDPAVFDSLRAFVAQHVPDCREVERLDPPAVLWTRGDDADAPSMVSLHLQAGRPMLNFHMYDVLETMPAWKSLASYVKFRNCLVFPKPLAAWPAELATVIAAVPGAYDAMIGGSAAPAAPASPEPTKKAATKPAAKKPVAKSTKVVAKATKPTAKPKKAVAKPTKAVAKPTKPTKRR